MHYKNGRQARNGDKVMLIPSWGPIIDGVMQPTPVVGILYDATAGNDTCNGRLAPISVNDPCPNLKECLRLDDALDFLRGAEIVGGTAGARDPEMRPLEKLEG